MKTAGDLQRAIFYCMENYDNWRDLPVVYQKDISKNKKEDIALHSNIDSLEYEDTNMIFISTCEEADDKTVALVSLSEMIDEMRENESEWSNKKLKFEIKTDFEFETFENVLVRSEDCDAIKDFFVNEECFILIGE
jgi:hypothetical protein